MLALGFQHHKKMVALVCNLNRDLVKKKEKERKRKMEERRKAKRKKNN